MANKKEILKITFETPAIFVIKENVEVEKQLDKKLKEIKKRTRGTF